MLCYDSPPVADDCPCPRWVVGKGQYGERIEYRHDPGVDHRKPGGTIRAIRHREAQLGPFAGNAAGHNRATHTQRLTAVGRRPLHGGLKGCSPKKP